tara:strand:+ start:1801 stop:1935 length:135 start_codon:yes stop_codon:yes gene_type:complete
MADNLNQGAAYIMGSDKVSVDDAQGSNSYTEKVLSLQQRLIQMC